MLDIHVYIYLINIYSSIGTVHNLLVYYDTGSVMLQMAMCCLLLWMPVVVKRYDGKTMDRRTGTWNCRVTGRCKIRLIQFRQQKNRSASLAGCCWCDWLARLWNYWYKQQQHTHNFRCTKFTNRITMSNHHSSSTTEEEKEESKVSMEDLTINEDTNTDHRPNTSNTKEDDAEMSLEERMNWLRERVSERFLGHLLIISIIHWHTDCMRTGWWCLFFYVDD